MEVRFFQSIRLQSGGQHKLLLSSSLSRVHHRPYQFVPRYSSRWSGPSGNQNEQTAEGQQPAASSNASETVAKTAQSPSQAQSMPPPPPSPPPQRDIMTDVDEIFARLDLNSRETARATESIQQSIKEDQAVNSTAEPVLRSSDPVLSYLHRRSPFSLSRKMSDDLQTDNYRPTPRKKKNPVELKLGTKLGRQVLVEPDRGVDLAGALRSLQMHLAMNKVRAQSIAQKYHVRRGQKRKNLKITRWRKLFRFSFDRTVSRIQRMRAQGW